MKCTCPMSGIHFQLNPGFGSASVTHPVFSTPLVRLIEGQLAAFSFGKLTEVETHLLGAALLAKLPIARWSHKLASPGQLADIWSINIQRLATMAGKVHDRNLDHLPKYSVTKQTSDLRGLGVYLDLLTEHLKHHSFSPIDRSIKQHQNYISDKIAEIVRGVKNTAQSKGRLPSLMAQWAATAGNFPNNRVAFLGKKVECRELWKDLIRQAFTPDNLSFLLSSEDIREDYEELLAYCETQIPYGSLHTDILLEKLRDTVEILQEFRPRKLEGEIELLREDSLASVYTRGSSADKVSDGVDKISHDGPDATPVKVGIEPKRNQFPSTVEYLKARLLWSQSVIVAKAAKDIITKDDL